MLTNATRGTWKTTPLGQTVTEAEIEPLWRDCLAEIREKRRRDGEAAEEAGAYLRRPMRVAKTVRIGRKSWPTFC